MGTPAITLSPGVLLALQDAQVPTHILAATSVGSINAASYAAHSKTEIGSAESLVDSWSHLTPPAMGINKNPVDFEYVRFG